MNDTNNATPTLGNVVEVDSELMREACARARAAHDRLDTLLLGRAAAARKRVARLLGTHPKPSVEARVPVLPVSAEERAAVAHAEKARVRVAALLAPVA